MLWLGVSGYGVPELQGFKFTIVVEDQVADFFGHRVAV